MARAAGAERDRCSAERPRSRSPCSYRPEDCPAARRRRRLLGAPRALLAAQQHRRRRPASPCSSTTSTGPTPSRFASSTTWRRAWTASPLAVLATTRPGEGDTGAIARLAAAPETTAIGPRPLSAAATATLCERRLGADVAPEFAAACREATGGNPFFLEALLREAGERRLPDRRRRGAARARDRPHRCRPGRAAAPHGPAGGGRVAACGPRRCSATAPAPPRPRASPRYPSRRRREAADLLAATRDPQAGGPARVRTPDRAGGGVRRHRPARARRGACARRADPRRRRRARRADRGAGRGGGAGRRPRAGRPPAPGRGRRARAGSARGGRGLAAARAGGAPGAGGAGGGPARAGRPRSSASARPRPPSTSRRRPACSATTPSARDVGAPARPRVDHHGQGRPVGGRARGGDRGRGADGPGARPAARGRAGVARAAGDRGDPRAGGGAAERHGDLDGETPGERLVSRASPASAPGEASRPRGRRPTSRAPSPRAACSPSRTSTWAGPSTTS